VGALVIACAFGLTRIVHGRALAAVVLVAAVLASRGVVDWYRVPSYEDYHAAAAELIPRLHRGDALIFTPDEVRIPAEFYLRGETRRLDLVPLFPPEPWGDFKTGEQRVADFGRATIKLADPTRHARVWLIAFRVHTALKPRISELARRYRVTSDRTYHGGIEVVLLEARGP
jgi:hypothetical protein